ncbi:MAG: PorT family protein [Acidobacteriia bacterium]|nr:PorT family protein [Terriglobia bacterium]
MPLLFVSAPAFSQRLFSIGIKGGVPLSDAFSNHTTPGIDTFVHSFTDSKNYVIGPFAELRLPFGFAVEADALYRPLDLTTDFTLVPQPPARSAFNISSWEFPILGKYHIFHAPVINPYVEAGPIFRATGSKASYLSNAGFAIGGGVDVKILRVRFTPELRYSRWGQDATVLGFVTYPSNLNQTEFLLGLSF